jgi:hypothetical protein
MPTVKALTARCQQLTARLSKLAEQEAMTRTRRDHVVVELYAKGEHSYRTLGALVGISGARVQQLVERARRDDECE